MDFRTKVDVPSLDMGIRHEDRGFLIGSCFASSIGDRLKAAKFRVCVNPFGVVYNPYSVAGTLGILESGEPFRESDLFFHDGLWSAFTHHGSFSRTERDAALELMNRSLEEGRRALADSAYVIVTLGTAWVYEHLKTGEVVNNCHKVPAREFRRFRMAPEEIVSVFGRILSSDLYKGKNILFTVSPIRHLKDGFAENSASKASLLLAVDELVKKHQNVFYFPAYEIVMDELRDYRFYDRDMLHPSETAIDYIWERFSQSLIPEPSRRLAARIKKVTDAAAHRPLNPGSPGHAAFIRSVFEEIERLEKECPFLDFSAERERLG